MRQIVRFVNSTAVARHCCFMDHESRPRPRGDGGHDLSMVDEKDVRRQLGRKLRSLRERRGLSTRQVARHAALSQSRIVRIEGGEAIASLEDVSFILDAVRADRHERWEVTADVFTLGRAEGSSVEFVVDSPGRDLQKELGDLMGASTVVLSMETLSVPELLQTREYMTACVSVSAFSHVDIESLVAPRLERQRVLLDESKTFRVLISETALRYRHVSAQALSLQYEHIIELGACANIAIGIVTCDVPFRRTPDLAFHIFDDRYICFDVGIGLIGSSLTDIVASRRQTFDYFNSVARFGDDATLLLRQMAQDVSSEVGASEMIAPR